MAGISVFLNRMFTVFFDCVSPASSEAKPRCMINTSRVATIIQMLLAVRPIEAAGAVGAASSANPARGRAKAKIKVVNSMNRFIVLSSSFMNF
jgi:hypothetical protein